MVAMDGLQSLRDERARFEDPYDDRYNSTWEGRSLKPYRTKDEYLYAMREDLAEWLSNLYDLEILPEAFFDRLENGSLLCQHANNVRRYAVDYHGRNFPDEPEVEIVHGIFFKHDDLRYKIDAKAGTFLARDNISNFIHWCRHSLRINDVLLFESDDLVMRKNDKSFILCLLEVARRGGPIGMPVPMLVQLEQEIDRELNAGTPSEPDSFTSTEPASPSSETMTDADAEAESEADSEGKPMECASSPEPSPQRRGPPSPKVRPRPRSSKHYDFNNRSPNKQITLNEEVLKTLDELVREQVNRCSCPMQFPMLRIAEGKYQIGDSNTLIFVRILRKHVMVRVGGGWDTLTHYLDKHDPCRCNVHKKGRRRSTAGADFGTRSPIKRRSAVKASDVARALNGQSSDGTTSPTDTATTRSDSPTHSPTPSPRSSTKSDVRPRSTVITSRRQSTGDTFRPTSLNLSARNSPRNSPRMPRRGNSFDASPRFVTSPDSSDTYSNPDLGGAVSPTTKDSTLKRNHNRSSATTRKVTPDSDSTACSELAANNVGSPLRRKNSTKENSLGINRTSQTATEEFMRRKRQQQSRAQSIASAEQKLARESVTRSAPTSPTRRRVTSFHGGQVAPRGSNDLMRRATLGASEKRTDNTKIQRPRDVSMSPSLSRRSSTPVSLSRKGRPQSAKTSREEQRRGSKTDEMIMMIRRGDDGRHRVDSTSSCESNDSSIKSGSRSLSDVPVRRLSETVPGARKKNRSVSIDRTNGISERVSAGEDRRKSLFDRTHAERKKPLDRSKNNIRKASVERSFSPKRNDRERLEKMQPRSRSLSRDWQTGNPRVQKPVIPRRPSGGSASAKGSPVRRRRHTDIQMPSDFFDNDYRTPLSSSASSPSSPTHGPSSRSSSRSRLRPPTAIPAHLKPDHSTMTSLRNDHRRDSRPTRIPLPTGHKRMMEAQNRDRSNSLPNDILADILRAWQSVENSTHQLEHMDPYDMSPCRSSEGDPGSPTSLVRTAPDLNHDSGYEDNANHKLSPNLRMPVSVLPSIDSSN